MHAGAALHALAQPCGRAKLCACAAARSALRACRRACSSVRVPPQVCARAGAAQEPAGDKALTPSLPPPSSPAPPPPPSSFFFYPSHWHWQGWRQEGDAVLLMTPCGWSCSGRGAATAGRQPMAWPVSAGSWPALRRSDSGSQADVAGCCAGGR